MEALRIGQSNVLIAKFEKAQNEHERMPQDSGAFFLQSKTGTVIAKPVDD
jgi:hypothetical protein